MKTRHVLMGQIPTWVPVHCDLDLGRTQCEQTDGQTDRRTRWTERVIPIYHPNLFAGGIKIGPKGLIPCTWVPCAIFVYRSDNQRPGGHRCWQNTHLVEDIEYLLPVKFHQIPFSGDRGEVENVLAHKRSGSHLYGLISKKPQQTWSRTLSTSFVNCW